MEEKHSYTIFFHCFFGFLSIKMSLGQKTQKYTEGPKSDRKREETPKACFKTNKNVVWSTSCKMEKDLKCILQISLWA